MVTAGSALAESANLLRNAEFRFQPRDASGRPGGETSHNVACWNTDAWGDITVRPVVQADDRAEVDGVVGIVAIAPGKRLYQFNTLPELGCRPGDVLTVAARAHQSGGGRLTARLTLLRIESADGEWNPKNFGCNDNRTFSQHGRGELVRGPHQEKTAPGHEGDVSLTLEGLELTTAFEKQRKSSGTYSNSVAVLVEFTNSAATGTVSVCAPVLAEGTATIAEFAPGRPVPQHYRKLPRTVGKLMRGEPIHILALGSSIDTGDANPRLYIYDEVPTSPTYKRPLWKGNFSAEEVGRPEFADYIGAAKQYVKYTGRLHRELMRKFNLSVDDVFINAMSCGGSSIGESHSGFDVYTALEWPPGPANGHPRGKTWEQLYPELFTDSKRPAPDLVVFGHGHNERIDSPDGIAVYEGAIRWFQKRFPDVEFLFCQWHRSAGDGNIPPIPKRRELCDYYGIPFINTIPTVSALLADWCNHYALCPDGGHPQAGAHTIWFRQLEQMFEIAAPLLPFEPQRRLPPRMNPYSYGWEGDVVTYTAPNPRIRGPRMVIDDTAFNLWCSDGHDKWMTVTIDGTPVKKGPAGNGRQMKSRDARNSSFVHGRLSLGDRHILELVGQGEEVVTVAALDCKVCDKRMHFPVGGKEWTTSGDVAAPVAWSSEWGAPYGDRVITLGPGQSLSIVVEATDLAVAYVDQPEGGTLRVTVSGEERLLQPCNAPFTDNEGERHFMENRRGIRDLKPGLQHVTLQAVGKSVKVLGLYAYDSRP
jgi:hypothetical protein